MTVVFWTETQIGQMFQIKTVKQIMGKNEKKMNTGQKADITILGMPTRDPKTSYYRYTNHLFKAVESILVTAGIFTTTNSFDLLINHCATSFSLGTRDIYLGKKGTVLKRCCKYKTFKVWNWAKL